MKRQKFTLESVLRYYVVQKQRTEFDLQQASRALREAEAEIAGLTHEMTAVATLLHGEAAVGRTTAGWLACYRKAESLDLTLRAAQQRRQSQEDALARLRQKYRDWCVAEETLLTLRRGVEERNRTEAARAQQVLVDETVLRQWLGGARE
jgi:flagellar export protein FliJ